MTLRVSKISLVLAVAFFYTLVVFNNLNDYNTNYQFARHVLMMDSTVPGNHAMWRAVNNSGWHTTFYIGIIAWELVVTLLCWLGSWKMLRCRLSSGATFEQSKRLPIAALTLALLMWLVAFVSVGGEWFLMWQSSVWNGEAAAFRMFTIIGVVLLLLVQPETEMP